MSLANLIKTGPSTEPLRIGLHGVPGVGKTTFAANIPGALFMGPEDGGGDLDLARITVTTWGDLLSSVQALTHEPHGYRVLVLDTIDHLERLLHQFLTKDESASSLEKIGGGYGKGYTMAAEEMVKFTQALDMLRHRRRMHVVWLAHTKIKKFDDPEGPAYDRYELAMHEKVAKHWLEWSDMVLFANYDIQVKTDTSGNVDKILKKGKASDREPARCLYTSRRPAFDAKNRYGLPFEMALDWSEFAEAIRWDDRDRAACGTTRAPSADDIGRAMTAAKSRGWKSADFVAVLARFGVERASEIPEPRRAEALAAFQGAPPAPSNTNTEAA